MDLILVPLTRRYLEFVRLTRNNPEVGKTLFTDVNISEEAQDVWYKKVSADRSHLVLVALASRDQPVGYCQITDIDLINYSCKLGVCIAPQYQSKGYGTELVEKLIKYAFSRLGMHRLYLEVFTSNEEAIRFYKNCGFGIEGILKDKVLKWSKFRDVTLMSYTE